MPNTFEWVSLLFGGAAIPALGWLASRWWKIHNQPLNRQLAKEAAASTQAPSPVKGFARHVYRNRYTPYVGRSAAWKALQAFLTSDNIFQWWLVCGGGGSGKSRLALEFCRHARGQDEGNTSHPTWEAAFVNWQELTNEDWESWTPRRDTILVFDYAAKNAEQNDALANVLAILINTASKKGSARIRVLLLEREYQDAAGNWLSWYNRLMRNTGAQFAAVEGHCYGAPLEFNEKTDDAESCAWQIMEFVFNEHKAALQTPPSRQEMLDTLRRIDPQIRPLFAILLAEAVADGLKGEARGTQWNKESLVHYVIERTYTKYWQPGGLSVADMLAVALATLCGGVNLTPELANAINGIAGTDTKGVSLSRLLNMGLTGKDAKGHTVITPLQPDIIGELFVLEADMSTLCLMEGKQRQLLPLAWERAPFETAIFFDRCSNDFLHHHNFHPWFMSGIHGLAWCMVGVNVIAQHVGGDIEKAREIYNAMDNVTRSPALDDARAKAAFNLINGYLKANKLDKTQHLYDAICALAHAPAVDEARAKASFNLINAYLRKNILEQAQYLHDDTCAIPSSPNVDEIRAKAAVNLISYYGIANDVESAQRLYDGICKLLSSPAVDEYRAKAAFNLIIDYDNANDMESAQRLYGDICKLLSSPAVDEYRAKAAFNLINTQLRFHKLEKAQHLYNDICALPQSPAGGEIRAMAAFNLIIFHLNALDLKQAQNLYSDICTLPNSPVVDELRAKMAVNLIEEYCNAHDLQQAQNIYDDICTLPRSPAVNERRAKAAVNLIVEYGNAQDRKQAQKLYNDICALPSSRAVDEQLAMAAFNIIVDCIRADDLKQTQQLYHKICTFSPSPLVDEQRAKAAVNIMAACGYAGKLKESRQLYTDICALPSSHAVDEQRAMAAFNLIVLYGSADDLKQAQHFYDEICAIPSSPAVDEIRAMAEALPLELKTQTQKEQA